MPGAVSIQPLPSTAGQDGKVLQVVGDIPAWMPPAGGGGFDPHSPGPIGDVTPSDGTFVNLTATNISASGGNLTISGTISVNGIFNTGVVLFSALDTTDPGVPGRLWNDAGLLRISS